MFCPYCGKEIKDSAKFCPYCGKALKTEAISPRVYSETQTQNNTWHRRTAAIAAAAAGCAALVILTLFTKPSKETKTAAVSSQENSAAVSVQDAEEGMTSQEADRKETAPALTSEKSDPLRGTVNPVLGGTASRGAMYPIVSDGDYVYIAQGSSYTGTGRIYRVPADGGMPEKIYEEHSLSRYLFYHDGWLYCSNNFDDENGSTFRITVDGSRREDLWDKPSVIMDITDQAIYFAASRDLNNKTYCRMDSDGSNCQELPLTEYLPDDDPYADDMDGILFFDGWIYFLSSIEESPGVLPYYIQRVRFDGSQYERLCRRTYPDSFVTDGESLYIASQDYGPLYRLKIGDEEAAETGSEKIHGFQMWYLNGYVNNINVETGEKTDYLYQSTASGSEDFSISGWTYYTDGYSGRLTDQTNHKVYQIAGDGTISLEDSD